MGDTKLVADTGIFIEFLRTYDKQKTTLYRIQKTHKLVISAVTLYELNSGAKDKQKKIDLYNIIGSLEVLPFDKTTAVKASEIYQNLKRRNKIIEFRDIFIAATALTNNLPILTRNKKHFQRIEGLKLV